ncbi:MAG: type II secretion system F family protein [Limnobacter sp.]|uniref:type II secretion system F family protein n=1 Tax=Limnobacter sp. TaxID=2003368 RepID=UPI00391A1C8A
MRRYLVTCINQSGQIDTKVQSAPSASAAELIWQRLGYTVVTVRESWRPALFTYTERPFDPIPLVQELMVLHRAGLSVPESLSALLSKATNAHAQTLQGLLASIEEGKSLADAMSLYPESFPKLLVAMIKTAEQTSNLPEALERYIDYADQVDVVKRKMKNAALYPSLLLVVGGGVLLFLLTYVIPRFAGIYEGLEGDLPWLSEMLLWWGRNLRDNGIYVFVIFAFGLGLAYKIAVHPAFKDAALSLLLQHHTVNRLWIGYRLSRLYRALGLLITGGIPVNTAFVQVEDLAGHEDTKKLRLAGEMLTQGKSVTAALTQAKLTTEVTSRLLNVGERTGSIGEMFNKSALLLEADTGKAVEAFSRIFEPLLMALIGIIIGMVVVLMYLPIFELANSLQ